MVDFNFSIFTQEFEADADSSGLVGTVVEALRARGDADRWRVTTDGFWCSLTPREHITRSQGWKLHLSATPKSAEKVLARSISVLLDGDCAFKFASTLAHVAQLNARHTPRGHSGKFITVYPHSDEEAVRLAEVLHQATAGLAGPRILSDRAYAPESLVHYRYGAFVEERRISNDGLYAWVIFDPDGNPLEDRRVGQYLPPVWSRCPFPDAGRNAGSNPNGDGPNRDGTVLFLAEELVPGMSLREWVLDRIRHGGWRRHIPDGMDMANRLVELMSLAHRAGLILRAFTPNNIMVLPDGQLRLIDLELAVLPGQEEEAGTGAGTPGYAAPEQMAGAPPAIAADYYSLGATICFVVTGSTPGFMADVPRVRLLRERLTEWLAAREAPDYPAAIHELILGLMDDDPERRLMTADARDALAAARKLPTQRQRTRSRPGYGSETNYLRLDDEPLREAVNGGVSYLLASMNAADPERLWSASCAHGAADPCAVQLGAAGVVSVLTRCFALTGDQRLPEAIATGGRWIDQRLRAGEKRPPGLYFGQAGIAWALYEAGRILGDDRLAGRGLTLAKTLPVSSENPDMTHGTAGIGLTFLHFWLRTGSEEFARRAGKSIDELIASVSEEPSGISWDTPAAFESRLAGGRYHGFAHGTAGVGYVLLEMALATGRSDCLELAYRAGETLFANAIVKDGVVQWSAGPGDEPTAPYWCHGSAGIGTFLIRLHRATGDDRFRKLADLSAQAVVENSWRGVLGQCHGLAGNGDFLLDMAEAAGGQRYEAMAHQLARVIFASRAYRKDQVVFPDERGYPSPTWAEGVSGILAFFLRLRHRSPRLWTVDSLLERSFS